MATKSSSRRSSAVATARRGYTVPDPVVPLMQQTISANPSPPEPFEPPATSESYGRLDRTASVIVTTDRSGMTVVTQCAPSAPQPVIRQRYEMAPVRSNLQTGKPSISVDPNAHDVRFSRTFGL
jgi:hypothetical protein